MLKYITPSHDVRQLVQAGVSGTSQVLAPQVQSVCVYHRHATFTFCNSSQIITPNVSFFSLSVILLLLDVACIQPH